MKQVFLLVLLLQAWALAGQCPPNCTDPRQIDFQAIASANTSPNFIHQVHFQRQHALHNEVLFDPSFTIGIPFSGHTLWLHPGDGTPPIQLENGQIVTHAYPLSLGGQDSEYGIALELRNPSGATVEIVGPFQFTIKATYSVGNAGYTAPDEVWPISTSGTFDPPVSGTFPDGSPYNGNTIGTADVYIRYAPGHNGKLLKPLIFVDGFDVDPTTYAIDGAVMRHGASGWDVFMLGNDDSAPNPFDPDPSVYRHYPAAMNDFLQNGYDVVFIDFADGTDYIQKNGLLLAELIQRINARKTQHAEEGETVCDNAVVGASMGGQIAKWALSYMEEQGIPHQTHTYVSFDSPQRGANIPLSIQSFAFLLHRSGMDESNFWGRLNSPAAREMLIASFGAGIESGQLQIELEEVELCAGIFDPQPLNLQYGNSALLRQSFQDEMTALGYPQQTRNVAISCGARTGEQLDFEAGETYLWARRQEVPPGIACGGIFGDVFWADCAALNGNAMAICYPSPAVRPAGAVVQPGFPAIPRRCFAGPSRPAMWTGISAPRTRRANT